MQYLLCCVHFYENVRIIATKCVKAVHLMIMSVKISKDSKEEFHGGQSIQIQCS